LGVILAVFSVFFGNFLVFGVGIIQYFVVFLGDFGFLEVGGFVA